MKNSDTVFQEKTIKYIFFSNEQKNDTYFSVNSDINNRKVKRYSNFYDNDAIFEQFRNMQEYIIQKELPTLSKLLNETSFDDGYESLAETYFASLYEKYGVVADTILQNIYLQNMYNNKHLLKHLLFIVSNLPKERRSNLEIIPLAGISNPDLEIQDLAVKCLESWHDKRHLPTLEKLAKDTGVAWFKQYINEVVEELNEV